MLVQDAEAPFNVIQFFKTAITICRISFNLLDVEFIWEVRNSRMHQMTMEQVGKSKSVKPTSVYLLTELYILSNEVPPKHIYIFYEKDWLGIG